MQTRLIRSRRNLSNWIAAAAAIVIPLYLVLFMQHDVTKAQEGDPTGTETPTYPATPTETLLETYIEISPTGMPYPTYTDTETPTLSETLSQTNEPSATLTSSYSRTHTITPTRTRTRTLTTTRTETSTPTNTENPTDTNTPSITRTPSDTPTPTTAGTIPPLWDALTLAAGYAHTCSLTSIGGVKCWGYNWYRQLGDGTNISRSLPAYVQGLTSGIAAISAGYGHTCALTASGAVKCWGYNGYGQLGDGTKTESAVPVDVIGLPGGIRAIAAGAYHTCALTVEGGVKCWGRNFYGALGDGTNNDSASPVDVIGLAGPVVSIAASVSEHTCVLISDGSIQCWGLNASGELGNGTQTNSSTPVTVAGMTGGMIAVGVGISHSCAITSGGAIKCWGGNSTGQLGNGTKTLSTTPVEVFGLGSGVLAMDGGTFQTCALLSGGGIKCWGGNSFGQLGDGSNTTSTIPVDVIGLASGATALAVGANYGCALTSGGGIKCWGNNADGQLGDGTNNNTPIPVDVIEEGPTPTPTVTPTPTLTITGTPPTETATPTETETPEISHTPTSTLTLTRTYSTITYTPTRTSTTTRTRTRTSTPTATATRTPITPTLTRTLTPTPITPTLTGYVSPTETLTQQPITPIPPDPGSCPAIPNPGVPPLSGGRGFFPGSIHVYYFNDIGRTDYLLDNPINWESLTGPSVSNWYLTAVDFNWNGQPPTAGVNGVFWSACFQGYLQVPAAGSYTFYLDNLDDGGVLYVGDLETPVISSWLVQGPHSYQATVQLSEGIMPIRLLYAQGPGNQSSVTLAWSSAGFAKEVIRGATSRYATFTPTVTVTPTPSNTDTPTHTPSSTDTPTPTEIYTPTVTSTGTPSPWIVVLNTADSGPGSLRQAIADVAGGGWITFDPSLAGQTITLASVLSITKDVTIDGSGFSPRVEISGNNLVRVFLIDGAYQVGLKSLVLKNGMMSSGFGGAISLDGGCQVTIEQSVLKDNTAWFGGAIDVRGGSGLTILDSDFLSNSNVNGSGGAIRAEAATMTIRGSRFIGNIAAYSGGAILLFGSGTYELLDNTFTGNRAASGGAIYVHEGAELYLHLRRNLFSTNVAANGGGALLTTYTTGVVPQPVWAENNTFYGNQAELGGAIYDYGYSNLLNNTFSGNAAGTAGADLFFYDNSEHTLYNNIMANAAAGADCAGYGTYSIIGGNNLVEDGSAMCLPSVTGDPLLGPLADNGGSTLTLALLDGSPAIDAGNDSQCTETDARGESRPQGSHCDIGAFEAAGMIIPTRTSTPSRTATETETPTPTTTETKSPTPTTTETESPTPTTTDTPTPTETDTPTKTPTRTPTVTYTPSYTQTPTRTSTPTRTRTKTRTPRNTRTSTITRTGTLPTNTRTPTPSITRTPTITRTQTATPTPTRTNTRTPMSQSQTPFTPSRTPTPASVTRTPTRTPTPT